MIGEHWTLWESTDLSPHEISAGGEKVCRIQHYGYADRSAGERQTARARAIVEAMNGEVVRILAELREASAAWEKARKGALKWMLDDPFTWSPEQHEQYARLMRIGFHRDAVREKYGV